MTRRSTQSAPRLLSLVLAFLLAFGVFTVVKNLGWLSPFGIASESHDSQVIRAIERTQEVSLLRLGIQGIKEKSQSREFFGKGIPQTEKSLFLQYNFDAKLGIDGAAVEVTKTGKNTYLISVPEFIFIGYDDPSFKVAVEDGDFLSWITPDIDEAETINAILNDDARQQYIDSNEELLEDQTKVFYNSLITSIDPTVVTRFEFGS